MDRNGPHQEVEHIFRELLPGIGMTERPEQIALCHRLLDAMLNGKIALCDAGTGIGKTHAFLVAGILFLRYRKAVNLPFRPVVVSTSGIALQKAIQRDYLPALSDIPLRDGLIDESMYGVSGTPFVIKCAINASSGRLHNVRNQFVLPKRFTSAGLIA